MAFRKKSGNTCEYQVAGNHGGEEFSFIGVFADIPEFSGDDEATLKAKVPPGETYNEIDHGPAVAEDLRRRVSLYQALVNENPQNPELAKFTVSALARRVFRGWRDPQEIEGEDGKPLPNSYKNRLWLLNQAGVSHAVILAWLDLSTGGRAELGNSSSSPGSGFTDPPASSPA